MKHLQLRHALLNAILVALPLLLLLADAILILWKVHSLYFVSVSWLQYGTAVWGIAAGIVALIPIGVAAIHIGKELFFGPESKDRPPVSIDRMTIAIINAITSPLQRPSTSIPISVALVGIAAAVTLVHEPTKSPRTSSRVVVVTRGEEKLIYASDRENGVIFVFQSSDLANPVRPIPIGSHGNQPGRGNPEAMIEFRPNDFRRNDLHLLFVVDTASDTVRIVDLRYDAVLETVIPVGKAPRSLAITPDHRKLFVSSEQPIPNGSITVIDTSANKPVDFRVVGKIDGVNCPEGIAVSPHGDRLYVATQCGGGLDPAFVIDTATNKKIRSIPGLAVGSSVAVSPDSRHLYVSRGNFPCQRPDPNERGSPLSIVNLDTGNIGTVCLLMSVGAVALSQEDAKQRYLFVANGNRLSVFDRQRLTDRENLSEPGTLLNDIALEGGIADIGVADDSSVYAFLPASRRLFIYAPTGLRPD